MHTHTQHHARSIIASSMMQLFMHDASCMMLDALRIKQYALCARTSGWWHAATPHGTMKGYGHEKAVKNLHPDVKSNSINSSGELREFEFTSGCKDADPRSGRKLAADFSSHPNSLERVFLSAHRDGTPRRLAPRAMHHRILTAALRITHMVINRMLRALIM